MHLSSLWARRLLIVFLPGLSVPAAAQHSASGPAAGPAADAQTGTLLGRVVSASGPVSAASVRLLELGRGELSHQDGAFHFERVPAGQHTVAVQRIGFAPLQRVVQVPAGDTTRVEIELTTTAIQVGGVVVTGTGRARGAQDAYRPTTVLDEAELRRQLGSSVAATLAQQPGISQRYNGPAASQPVIRGLSGDRVLMLEDGVRTGDIASGAADHAVTVEPLTAERIEVLRGPAGLLYGSNALGGVVNVVRQEVPRSLQEELSGTFSAQAESANQGITAGGALSGAAGSLAWRAELTGRTASDTRTPLGDLPSTGMEGLNASAGTSWVHDAGFAGLAVRDYHLEYGVPGTFQGQTIPGAHEGGVTIDLRRTSLTGEAELFSGFGPFNSVEWQGRYTRYEQNELEGDGRVGTRFGQLTASSDIKAHHSHRSGGMLTEGTVGVWGHWQDLRSAGSSGTRPARALSLAAFAVEELGWGAFRLQLGARYDWTRVTPLDTDPGLLGNVRERDFGALSGSAAALFEVLDGVVLGSSLSRAFRTPSIDELFSNGPHLADYSYNIGNPELEAEHGTGLDAFVRLNRPRLHAEAAVYRNWIDGYVYYAPTGRLDPRLRRFPLYRAAQDDAVLQGAEGRIQWEAVPAVVLDATASYVHAARAEGDEPLPAIPPLHASLGVRYDAQRFFASLGWEGAGEQDRVSEFERPTDGYSLWRAGAGLRWSGWGNLHTLTLQVANLTDEVYREHLSRIKEVAPQPGRNVELLYRVSF